MAERKSRMKTATELLDAFAHVLGRICVTNPQGDLIPLNAAVERIIKLVRERTRNGCKIMFIGNGGSAAIASHLAVDYWKNGGMRAIAFNDSSLLTCVSNDFSYPQVFEKPIEMFADPDDVLVAISSSGKSANILNGAGAARGKGCSVITCSGFLPDNPLRKQGDLNIYIDSQSYGFVETGHLLVLHTILDLSMEQHGAADVRL